MKSRFSGVLGLACGATLISFSPVFVQLAEVGPSVAGVYRCLFGGGLLLAIVLIGREPLWRGARPMLLVLLAAGLFAADLSFWHRSIEAIGPGLATIVGNFQVFVLAGFGWLVLQERLSWRFVVSVPVAFAGLLLLVGPEWNDPESSYRWGIYYGLLTAITFGGYILVLRQSQSTSPRLSAVANLALVSLGAASIMAVVGRIDGEAFLLPNGSSWVAMVAYGVLCHAAGWVFISRALPGVEASRAGLVLLLQPTLAFVWDVVFFGRPTRASDLAGAALALAAIYLGSIRTVERTNETE